MILEQLTDTVTIQGDVVLTLWDGGEIAERKRVVGTEDLSLVQHLEPFYWLKIKYIFAAEDGLHIDFEEEC